MIIGPWRHGGEFCIDEQYLGKTSFDHIQPVLAFFDKHLKNIDLPQNKNPKVVYYTLNQNQWKIVENFPPNTIKYSSFSLTSQNITFTTDSTTTNGTATRYNLDFAIAKKHFPDRKPLDEKKLNLDFYEVKEDMVITGMPILKLVLKTQNPDPPYFCSFRRNFT
ncbi:MAG: hypothetical protein KatS3mg035_0063 [Bacteroidia bacterium]|nr:MAG: hypothetical protein KatS3mg035_0063 [Bacteroidia bacterium]